MHFKTRCLKFSTSSINVNVMNAYGTTLEDLARIRVKAATYGQINDRAVYRKPVTMEMFNDPESRMAGPVAKPLRVGDCCANADGSSCVIVASEDKAKAVCDKPVWILGVGSASETVNLAGRDLFTGLSVARAAAEQAYSIAGVGPRDVDLAEVHDATAFGELLQTEALGFCGFGQGGAFAECGATKLGGRLPVNTSGGLESRGHPIGASGLGQIHELVTQLRHEAGPRQVKGCEIGLAENGGGILGYEEAAMAINILGRN